MNSVQIINVLRFELLKEVRKRTFILLVLLPPLIVFLIFMVKSNTSNNELALHNDTSLDLSSFKSKSSLLISEVDSVSNPRIFLGDNTSYIGLLALSNDSLIPGNVNAVFYLNGATSLAELESIIYQLKIIIAENLLGYEFLQVKKIIDEKVDVKYRFIKSESSSLYGLVVVAIIVIYLLVFQFSGKIMKSISEEKNNKISEILLSSMNPENIVIGKILNGFILALLQIMSWIIIFYFLIMFIGPLLGVSSESSVSLLMNLTDTVSGISFFMFCAIFTFMLLGGYLLYAVFFSIIGAISNENTDAQQFSFVVTMPLLVTFIYSFQVLGSDNVVLTALSYIPLTSPIAMMARLLCDVDYYEVVISGILLFVSIGFCLKYSSVLYKRGILSSNDKVNLRTIVKWIKDKRYGKD